GATWFWLGAPAAALTHFTQGLALYDPKQHRSAVFQRGDYSGVMCLSRGAWALWLLGYPHQALARSHEAMTLAQQLAHPFSLSVACSWVAALHQFRREVHVAQEYAETAINIATEQGFPFWMAVSSLLRGWALVHEGQVEEGIGQIQQ